jgi:hypothetical protein
MKTGCFFTYDGPGRISIARFAPRDIPEGYCVFKQLAPRRWFNSASKDEFEEQFNHHLRSLDPLKIWIRLHELAGTATLDQPAIGGISHPEPVLLCWERYPFDHSNWCHRSLVARWFHDTLGKDVSEL